jgi:hypothetical protein
MVTMETEENVFLESFGGTQTGKSAYSVIYINQIVAKELE